MPKKKLVKSTQKSPFRIIIMTVVAMASMLTLLFTMLSYKDKVVACANSISCIKDLTGEYEEDAEQGVFMGKSIVPPTYIAANTQSANVLGESTEEKHIKIDLTNQMLYALEGDTVVYEFPISSGKWGRTPTGTFRIWTKLLYTRMEGGSGADYYNLPNVPYTMYFYNDQVPQTRGFGIHGAYWHNNFGYPMSHGCVNMRQEDVAKIYEWAGPVSDAHTTRATADNPGTLITIYGETPE